MASHLDNERDGLVSTAIVIFLAMVATVGMALGFQHIGGYIPCKLCLEQRWPYYIGAPLMFATAYLGGWGVSRGFLKLLLILGALILAVSLYLGVKHTGVEYGWWAGPTDCGAVSFGGESTSGGVLGQLDAVRPPSCDTAAWRDPVLRLSFAGWNAVISFVLLVVAIRGAVKG